MQDDLLYALNNGIIDLDTIRVRIKEMKEREILDANHVWQSKDGYWKCYVSDPTKANGRRLVKKKNKEDLLKILDGYVEHHTIKNLFVPWVNFKSLHTKSSASIKRIYAVWNKYYKTDEEFINKPIDEMSKNYIDAWIHALIKVNNLDKKQFYNITLIARQIFDYAYDEGYITTNTFRRVKVNKNLFRREKKKQSSTQVYQTGEFELIEKEMLDKVAKRPFDTAPLAVLLMFETGIRIGELVAIKESDIEDGYLHVQRQEVRTFEQKGDYDMSFKAFEVVEYAKTQDGDREIYLTNRAKELIKMTLEINEKYGNACDNYLFVVGNKRITHYAVQARVLRGCKKIGIPIKTSHKIRKTYISAMIDGGINIDEIRRMVGHSDERTTYANYCFNRDKPKETELKIEQAMKSIR